MRGILTVTPRENETCVSKITHDEIQGKFCVVLEAEVGKSAWLVVKTNDDVVPWHRIQTSSVEQVMKDRNKMYIFTEMSTYCITSDESPIDMPLNVDNYVQECWRRH